MASEIESNNAVTSANALAVGTPMSGALSSLADVDFFVFVASTTGDLKLTWDNPAASTGNAFVIRVLRSDGTLLAEFHPTADAVFTFVTTAGAPYFVSIGKDVEFSSAAYQFWLGNVAPSVTTPMLDQATTAQQNFEFVVPIVTFADLDGAATLTYSATLADGSALPSWLHLDATTRAFSGTPSLANVGDLDIRVTATDSEGASATDVFRLSIGADDFAANPGTMGVLATSGNAMGNLSQGGDKDWFAVTLTADTAYRFDLRGAVTNSGTLVDPWLKLFSAQGTTLAADDDGASPWDSTKGHSTNSQIVFRPSESGVYYLEANGFDLATGTYTLSSQVLANDYHIAGLVKTDKLRWNASAEFGTPVTVTFSFPATKPVDFAPDDTTSFAPMNAAQMTTTRQVLQDIAGFSGITFVEVSGATGQIRFGTSAQMVSGGFTDETTQGNQLLQVDIAIDNSNTQNGTPTLGSYGYYVLIHEIGHALGLEHPGNYNAGGGGSPSPYLPTSQDSAPYSVMSYNFTTGYLDIGNAYQYATSMMTFDIAALQMLYGADQNSHTGNDIYIFNGISLFTIWDAAGTDVIDESAWASGVTINLCPGAVSYSGIIGSDTLDQELRPRLAIAYDCIIENAIGTALDDLLIGNLVANTLSGGGGDDWLDLAAGNDIGFGGAGNDTLIGGGGNDRLDGGAGTDTARFAGKSSDYYVVANGADLAVIPKTAAIRGLDGVDTLTGVEQLNFTGDGITRAATATDTQVFGLSYIASYADLRGAFGTDAAAGVSHFLRSGLNEGRVASFDGLKYIASYPDLVGVFGTNAAAATAHYITRGLAEGRVANFDAYKYIASYTDLISAFGSDTTAATAHYITRGLAEGRVVNFDAMKYIASYTDLVSAFGTDTAAATAHYVQRGFSEGRVLNFDAYKYIASYTDLIGAFGTDTTAATAHYVRNGFNEGRTANFDAEFYLAKYPDLRAAFGTDQTAAAKHFIQFGSREGRMTTTAGDDLLTGSSFDDILNAYLGNDTLFGLGGNDRLTGGSGADTFVFGANQGRDVITDFSTAQGDHIRIIAGTNGITTTAQALAHIQTDASGNALLDLGNGNTVTLLGIAPANLHASDFLIG